MSWLARPHVWFPLALLAVTAGGAYLLADPACTHPASRDLRFYWLRHYWQCAFDATSLACGVGLLSYNLDEDFTSYGRWVVTGIGLSGAVLFVAATAQGWQRLARTNRWPLPLHPLIVVAMFVAVLVVAVGTTWLAEGAGRGAPDVPYNFAGATWRGIAAAAGFGTITARPVTAGATLYALLGCLSLIVCAVGVTTGGAAGRVRVRGYYVVTRIGTYFVLLAGLAILLTVLEQPRGSLVRQPTEQAPAGANETWPRFGRALAQVASSTNGGFSTAEIADRGLSDGGKMLLATTVLVGGISGGPTSGVSWALLLTALGGVTFLAGRRRIGALDASWVRTALAAAAAVLVTMLITLVIAIGLLVLESSASSRYQAAPTFADAFLDAAAAVGGARMTSGITAVVTSRNLTMGIGLPFDLYQYGVAWLMLAMLIGRWLPVLALGWATGRGEPPGDPAQTGRPA